MIKELDVFDAARELCAGKKVKINENFFVMLIDESIHQSPRFMNYEFGEWMSAFRDDKFTLAEEKPSYNRMPQCNACGLYFEKDKNNTGYFHKNCQPTPEPRPQPKKTKVMWEGVYIKGGNYIQGECLLPEKYHGGRDLVGFIKHIVEIEND